MAADNKPYVEPMMAELHETPFDNKDWIFEVKYDGYRVVTRADGKGHAQLYSRNLKDLNADFPAVAAEMVKLKQPCLLDGEVVVEDEHGISKFQLMQNFKRRGGTLKYYVFDILSLDKNDLTTKPLLERKAILKKFLRQHKLMNVVYSDHVTERGAV